MKADFIISLVRDPEAKQRILSTAQNSNIPTIQSQLYPWEGFYKDDDQITVTDNYVVMIPSYIVFDNMLHDFVEGLNITTDIMVIYDEKYRESTMRSGFKSKLIVEDTMEYEWRQPFQNLSVPVHFEQAERAPELITAHLNRLEQATRVLLFVTDTITIEKYVFAAQRQIEANLWTWLVFTKDTLPFKCLQCADVQIYWARVVKSTSTEELSNFSDFVWSEELETQFLFSRNTYNHLQTSYCLDIIYTAIDYLIGINVTKKVDPLKPVATTPAPPVIDSETRSTNLTVRFLLERNDDYDFGRFVHNYAHYYFQFTSAIVVRIDRMSRFHDARFSKHVANWTFVDGIVPMYQDALSVNVRQLTHYRVVTILQEPFVEIGGPEATNGFQGYCIDLLEMIREDLNFTYDIYLVPDGKFGAMEQTGNWNGMIGQLVSGEADIALGPISVIAERETDIDFTVSFYDLVGTTILMRRTEVEYSLFKFLMASRMRIYWFIVLFCLGVGMASLDVYFGRLFVYEYFVVDLRSFLALLLHQ